jgi:serine phosphatase RsbU (regulator of sigma subunit)
MIEASTTSISPRVAAASGDSFTSSPTFQARLLISERWRFGLMIACYALMLGAWIVRRLIGDSVASNSSDFFIVFGGLAFVMTINSFGLWRVNRAIVSGATPRSSGFPWGAAIDLLIPLALMLATHLRSTRGMVAGLTTPVMLVLSLTILLSTLRLRPGVCLSLGIAAAFGHWALVVSTVMRGALDAGSGEVPLLASYGLLLLVTGFAAAGVANLFRETIRVAVTEAEQAERTAAELRSVEHELDIARTIQQGLLPKLPPKLDRFDVAGMSRPATQTGGDFYDWQPLPDGRVIIAIADVTGHGIGPALVMAVCRAYCRAITPTMQGADQFLDSVNELVSRDLTSGRFITMAVVVASPSGSVDILSAGHGPTFLWRAQSKEIERFDGQGLPLGIADDERYTPVQQRTLSPGDMIVLLTDGFMEAQSTAKQLFGIKRLEGVIRANAGATSAEMIRAIDEAVRTHSQGREQDDDMTAVVLRYT